MRNVPVSASRESTRMATIASIGMNRELTEGSLDGSLSVNSEETR